MWGDCSCGHHRANHPWDGREHGACGHCTLCDKPSREHVFVSHQFTRCPCNEFEQAA